LKQIHKRHHKLYRPAGRKSFSKLEAMSEEIYIAGGKKANKEILG